VRRESGVAIPRTAKTPKAETDAQYHTHSNRKPNTTTTIYMCNHQREKLKERERERGGGGGGGGGSPFLFQSGGVFFAGINKI
jgi:hypothetical protein